MVSKCAQKVAHFYSFSTNFFPNVVGYLPGFTYIAILTPPCVPRKEVGAHFDWCIKTGFQLNEYTDLAGALM